MKKVNLIGQRFGKLTVVEKTKERRHGNVVWLCQCDCGNYTYVRTGDLRSNHYTQSCGCLSKKYGGLSKTRLYTIWYDMIDRCYNPKNDSYERYGTRGIGVCDDWKNNFIVFYIWALQNGYKDKLTLDRVNVNDDYCPNNCRWVDMKTQQRNRSNNRLVEYNGKSLTTAELAESIGISPITLRARLNHGWDIIRAVETPVRNHDKLHNISSSF